jgi:hypothetical protein
MKIRTLNLFASAPTGTADSIIVSIDTNNKAEITFLIPMPLPLGYFFPLPLYKTSS